eukprot:jgi/Chlat1/8792/Chrsp90S09252
MASSMRDWAEAPAFAAAANAVAQFPRFPPQPFPPASSYTTSSTRAEMDDEWASTSDDEDQMDEDGGDTNAAQALKGKDIQGIPWNQLQWSRERYRHTRLQQYKNYENLNFPHTQLDKECKQVRKTGRFFDFRYNTRAVKCTIVHFQLRNLVWATSKHDVYVMHHCAINHWSPVRNKATEVLNLGGGPHGVSRVQISTMAAQDNLIVAGGFNGEMVCKNVDQPGLSYNARITHDENAITNAVELFETASGAKRIMTSNNDSIVRVFDTETFVTTSRFYYPWAVNHTTVSPDKKLVCVVGDDPEGFLADSQSGKPVASLKGHLDYSFASAWHPDGRIFATGNQDTTCRLWDIRYLASSMGLLRGRIGAIRSLRFSNDGQFLAMAEPADFVHLLDSRQDYTRGQEIDLFGEVAGISFSPDSEAFYIGVADRTYGSLLEFNRHRARNYLTAVV